MEGIMAKKIKFPLEMANGVKARTLEELQQNFNLEKVLGYYFDGKLQQWLADRYYKKELNGIEELSVDDQQMAEKLCSILGVQYEADAIDTVKDIAWRNERLAKLKQYTDDENLLANIDAVAFNQEELADLFDADIEKIYLCEGKFHVPEEKMNLEYIEFGGAEIVNKPKEPKVNELEFEVCLRYEKCNANDGNRQFRNGKNGWLNWEKLSNRNFLYDNEDVFLTAYSKSTDGAKIMLTETNESITCFIYDNDRLIYSTASNEYNYQVSDHIYEMKKDGTKTKITAEEINAAVYFIHLDNTKVVWAQKDGSGFKPPIYVKYFDEPESKLIYKHTNSYAKCPSFNWANGSSWVIHGDSFYYCGNGNKYIGDHERLWRIDMRTREVIEGLGYHFIKLVDKRMYAYGRRGEFCSPEEIFEINLETLEERAICKACYSLYGSGTVRDIQGENDKIIWMDKEHNKGWIHVYDISEMKRKTIVEVNDLAYATKAFFLVKDEWIYFGSIMTLGNKNTEYGCRMIKIDGSEMQTIKSINEILFKNQPENNYTELHDLIPLRLDNSAWKDRRELLF